MTVKCGAGGNSRNSSKLWVTFTQLPTPTPGPFTHSLGAAPIYQSTDFRKEMNLRSISDWNCRGLLVDRMQLLYLGCSQSQDSCGHADFYVFSLTPSLAQLTAVSRRASVLSQQPFF